MVVGKKGIETELNHSFENSILTVGKNMLLTLQNAAIFK